MNQNNPQNKIVTLNIDIAEKDVKIANRLNNPSIFYKQNMGKAGVTNPQELGAAYEIPLFKRMPLKKFAKANLKSAENIKIYKTNELVYNIKEAYFELLYKKGNLKIMEMEKDVAKNLLDNATKESKKGKIPETDVVLAKIEYNSSIMNCNEAQFEVVAAKNRLNAIMNTTSANYDTVENTLDKDYKNLLTIDPLQDDIQFDEIKKYTFTHRHDLLSAKANVEGAKANLSIVKSQLIPDLEVAGGWYYYPTSVSDSGRFENGSFLAGSLTNIPLVYQYKPEIQKAKLEIEKAEMQYKDLEIDITRQLSEVWERYLMAKNHLNFYDKELLKNSLELQKVAIDNLKKNKISMTEFLVVKQRYIELLINYNEALTAYYTTYAKLLKEIDILDINTVKSINL